MAGLSAATMGALSSTSSDETAVAVAPKTGRGRSSLLLWGIGLLCGVVLVASPDSVLLTGVLLSPALLVALVDRGPVRLFTRSALLAGVAASLDTICRHWTMGGTITEVAGQLGATRALPIAWVAIGATWLALEGLALGIRMILEIGARLRQTQLDTQLGALTAEWGDAP